ncbi:MAG TPA: IS1595 family transposase [Terriglobales bacterium]|nr:IS1595 family transposase [Terriglobales bacterium]
MPTSAGLYNEKQPLRLAKFSDLTESDARQILESIRWPEGPVCVHCGEINDAKRLKPRPDSKKPVRNGVWKCSGCREQFTVTVGTVFEDSHIDLHRWLLVAYLMCASKKGMSAHQIHRMLGISYKTVWFMCHRLRFAMSQHGMIEKLRGIVEIDEVWIGPKEKGTGLVGTGRIESKKRPVVALMERSHNGSRVRSFPIERVTLANIKPIMKEHVEVGTNIQTDEATVYHWMHEDFPGHDVVTHAKKQYSYRTEDGRHVTTNTVEGYFGLVRRSVFGTYHHWGRGYLQQYLNELDFRYNNRKVNDSERTMLALRATEGKRLTLREPSSASA